MKKILITLSIILALSLIFVACNKNTNENETEDTTNVPTEITTTTATEDTESDTEVTTESSEETSTKADESTSEEETTTEEHTTENTNEFLELMSRVDQAMAEVEFFRITETSDTIADGVSIVTYERTTRFDGYYANITDCTDNKAGESNSLFSASQLGNVFCTSNGGACTYDCDSDSFAKARERSEDGDGI